MDLFNSSLLIDKRLYKEDIEGSIAHVKMLDKSSIISSEEAKTLILGLNIILEDIEKGVLKIEGDYEDIHSFVEKNLTCRVGKVAEKLNIGRSKYDQIALDIKLYAKKSSQKVIEELHILNEMFINFGKENNSIMPDYTNMRKSQIVTFQYHLDAYVCMFKRDMKRLENAIKIMDESPMCYCTSMEKTYGIDKEFISKELGFLKPVDNFLDGVSDRDYLVEMISCFSIIMMHLSKMSEELILWSTSEFNYIQIDDKWLIKGSMLSEKRNPQGAELIRGKTGRVYGNLMSILTMLKALPLSYNKDIQEDKEEFFDALDTTLKSISIMGKMISTIKIKKDNMKKAVEEGYLSAIILVNYLVSKGMNYKNANKTAENIIMYCKDNNKKIESLDINEFQQFSYLFEQNIYEFMNYDCFLEK